MSATLAFSLGVYLMPLLSPLAGSANMEEFRAGSVAASVGKSSVTLRDIALRLEVQRLRGARESTDASAMAELLRESLELEVARQLDVEPTSSDIDALRQHTLASTRDPEVLAELQRRLPGRYDFDLHVLLPRATELKLRWRYEVGAVDPPSRTYEEWYRSLASRIPISLANRELSDTLCSAYAGVWWLESACVGVR